MLLLIPPLTQLNTPYPATAYLKGFLEQQGVPAHQGDLGLDLILELFNRQGLVDLFAAIDAHLQTVEQVDPDVLELLDQREAYLATIDEVVAFLQNKRPTLGYRIAKRTFLPEGPRFEAAIDLEWHFGTNSVQDQARYLCSLYLEDLVDLVSATVGPYLGISKYAERISRTASSFDPIEAALTQPNNYVDDLLIRVAARYFEVEVPEAVGFTVPFGGNLYGALKVGQWIKQQHPQTTVIMGGGYPNTELRDLTDPRVFDYVDYITLDDGEGPILALLRHINEPTTHPFLKRTFRRKEGKVEYVNTLAGGDFGHAKLPAPDYRGLRLEEYLSMFDMPNPMHRLWNDGRWNKLTIAHGCYWKRCSFCDVTLDYIGRFEQSPAKELVDKMEALIAQTGETGFHFVDEAAPPLAMRDLALEILRRGLQVTWWTNIRFEKTFTPDLCRLLAASGCIAVTGGLEVATNRLLELMEKGVTVEQVARVCKGFRDAGIMVHAYLMYGFPTETEQETIDSLEIVRQLFAEGLVHSAFWHQFAMTAHSPVGKDPAKYKVVRTGPEFAGFANNDLFHEDPTGCDHAQYSEGLNKALYNYMHDNGLDFNIQEFFDFPVPQPTVPRKLVRKALKQIEDDPLKHPGYRVFHYRGMLREVGKHKGKIQLEVRGDGGLTQITVSPAVANCLQQHWSEMDLLQSNGVDMRAFTETLRAASGAAKAADVLVFPWWRELQKTVVWVVKMR
jgi:radical SAM superfamily enzyme YgiQ (UPF0313 family)